MTVKQLSDARPDGVSMGQSATDKISLYGFDPVVQAATIPLVSTTIATNSTVSFGFTNTTQAQAVVDGLNAVVTALKNLGAIAVA
jgi:hypothetical protein